MAKRSTINAGKSRARERDTSLYRQKAVYPCCWEVEAERPAQERRAGIRVDSRGLASSSLSDLTRRRWMWRKMSTYGTALAEKKSDDRSDWNFQHLHLRWLNVVFGYRGRVSGLCRPAVAFVAGADGIAASDSRRC